MPSIIATTTSRELEAALIQRIAAIVPTAAPNREIGWRPAPQNRRIGESSTEVPRLFVLELVPGDIVPGGLTGNADTETTIGCDIVADYRAFDVVDVGDVVEADLWDLYDDFTDAINVVPGLTHVELAGEPQPDGDEEARRIRFPFLLHYMRAR